MTLEELVGKVQQTYPGWNLHVGIHIHSRDEAWNYRLTGTKLAESFGLFGALGEMAAQLEQKKQIRFSAAVSMPGKKETP